MNYGVKDMAPLPLLPMELDAAYVVPSLHIPLLSPPLSCPSDLLLCFGRALNMFCGDASLVRCIDGGPLCALMCVDAE